MTAEGVVMTFNLGRGATGPRRTDQAHLGQVAAVIAPHGSADVASLQEVHRADLPLLIDGLGACHGLTYHGHFTATVAEAAMRRSLQQAQARGDDRRVAHLDDRLSDFGIAVLSKEPLSDTADHVLPDDRRERRAAQEVRTRIGGEAVTIVNTHLGLIAGRSVFQRVTFRPSPQRAQTEAFLAIAARAPAPVIATGDLNQDPSVLAGAVRRTCLQRASDLTRPTCGRRVLDHVLVSSDITVLAAEVRDVPVSDHRPVVVHLRLPVVDDPPG